MDESKSMLKHISKVEMFSRKLEAAGSPVEESDVIMTLLSSLRKKYRALVVALETRKTDLFSLKLKLSFYMKKRR